MYKRGNSGIGILIIFIALVIMAVIATAILIQTAGSLQEKGISTSEEAQNQIVTATQVIEISGSDGRYGEVKWIEYTTKLVPGSEPIDLANAMISFNVKDTTFTYNFAGSDALSVNAYNGYYTWNSETVAVGSACDNDYDLDGAADYIIGGLNSADAMLSLTVTNVTLGSCLGGSWVPNFSDTTYLSAVSGNCYNNNVTNVTLTPANYTRGYFSVEYVQRGINSVTGQLMNGDVIKVFMEAPRNLTSDEVVKINFIPRVGSPTYTVFRMPKIVASTKIYLYP